MTSTPITAAETERRIISVHDPVLVKDSATIVLVRSYPQARIYAGRMCRGGSRIAPNSGSFRVPQEA